MNRSKYYWMEWTAGASLLLLFTIWLGLQMSDLHQGIGTKDHWTVHIHKAQDSVNTHKNTSGPERLDAPKPKSNKASGYKGDKREVSPQKKSTIEPTSKAKSLIKFDPNKADMSTLLDHGLEEKTAHTWINYLQKGGRFRTKEDVRKIYGLSETQFLKIERWLDIPAKPHESTAKEPKKAANKLIEINTATAEEWKQLHGIGKVLSERIVKFRERLGGFSHIAQVQETYGISDSLFLTLEGQLYLIRSLEPININQAEVAELAQHPYISYRQAKILYQYRNQHGPFNEINEISASLAGNAEWLERIRPYLTTGTEAVGVSVE